jgi:hypothetical protein
VALWGTIDVFRSLPQTISLYQQRTQLIQKLEELHVDRAYSEYWTCNVSDQFTPGFDRYLPYRQAVMAAPHPGYIFPADWESAPAIAARLHSLGPSYHRLLIYGFVVYYCC